MAGVHKIPWIPLFGLQQSIRFVVEKLILFSKMNSLSGESAHLHVADLVPINLSSGDGENTAQGLEGGVSHGGVAVVHSLLVVGFFLAKGLDNVVGGSLWVLKGWVRKWGGKENQKKGKSEKRTNPSRAGNILNNFSVKLHVSVFVIVDTDTEPTRESDLAIRLEGGSPR
jgi:hypothetical protein